MKVFSYEEGLNWLRSRGIPLDETSSLSEVFGGMALPGFETESFKLPVDSGRKTALARLMVSQLKTDSQILISIRNWNVWPSSGHPPLLMRLRHALGCLAELETTPCHLLTMEERDDAISVLILSLEFFWDCLVVGSDSKIAWFASHDEFFTLLAQDKDTFTRVKNVLENGKWGTKMSQAG